MPRMNWVAAVGTLAGGVAAYPPAIWGLDRLGLRQVVRADVPDSHRRKSGTPTAGGVVFVAAAVAAWATVARDPAGGLLVGAAALGCLVGLADDWAKVHRGDGLRLRPKLLVLMVCAALLALGLHAVGALDQVVPGLGVRDLGPLGLALAAFAVLGTGNAANLADGVDGLAAGAAIPALGACAALAALEHRPQLATTVVCLAAALLAFLCYNRPRARIFMGDAGSLAVGLAVGVAAVEVGGLVLLPLLALVFLAEAGSVLVQLSYFRLTHGRRLFRASPLHHHFEEGGMSEWGVDLRLWGVAMVAAALAAYWAVAVGLPRGLP